MKINAIWDPTDSFPGATKEQLANALGLLPSFAASYPGQPETLENHVVTTYGFASSPFEGFTIHDNYVLSYPGDPDTPPYAVLNVGGEEMVIYPHAWVLFPKTNNIYRMD